MSAQGPPVTTEGEAIAVDRRAVPWRRPQWGTLTVLLVVGMMLPWVFVQFGMGSFILHLTILFLLWSVVTQSWNLVLGVSGIYSFARIAFFAIGGWTTGVFALHFGWNPWVSLLLAPVAAVVAALIVGLPTLRLRGVYVVLLTLAFHELVRHFAVNGPEIISGGGYGLIGVPRLAFGDVSADHRLIFSYYTALAVFVLTTAAMWWVFRSPLGMAFAALRDSESYAVSRGIDQFRMKLFLFGFSAFFTGLAGGVMTHYLGSISPSILAFSVLIGVLAMIVIGGWGSFGGPILGAALLIGIQELLHDLGGYRSLAIGIALVVIVVFAPEGLWPRIRDGVARLIAEPEVRDAPGEGEVDDAGPADVAPAEERAGE